MTTIDVSFDEVLGEIERLSNSQPEGFTIVEMAEHVNHTRTWCRREISRLIQAGKVRYNGNATRPRIDGQTCRVPVYIFVASGE